MTAFARRLIGKVATLRDGEARTALLMFAYSFLAMMAFNILKPVTRSKFISDLGADNLPWAQLVAGLIIGLLMHLYGMAARRVPRRWVIPVTLAGEAILLLAFWALFRTGAAWVSAAFYVMGLMLGVLLISQFWTLANDIYDARQAKRLFGFIGGGASLGGAMGAGVTAFAVQSVGANNLLLVSAFVLVLAVMITTVVTRRQSVVSSAVPAAERGVGAIEAIRLLRSSRQLQVIAVIIGLAAFAAGVLDQQLVMAVSSQKGEAATDAITAFLAQVGLWVSIVGFVVQVGLTSRIHRSFGLALALLILPFGLGSMAALVIATGALWAAAGARVLDSSLRYTIDKTTREVLYLPLPADLKQSAKPFIDVTVDRFAKALSGVLLLVLIKPWGLALTWQQLSYATLGIALLWIGAAIIARREYLKAFRLGLSTRAVSPITMHPGAADLAAVEALVEELSSAEDASVLYAIDVLESLEKPHLITPLLLHHPSPQVRARVLVTFASFRRANNAHWVPAIERLLEDQHPGVRSSAMRALAALKREEAPAMLRQYLEDPVPRVAVAAATVLIGAGDVAGRAAAIATLERLAEDTRSSAAEARREVAAGLASIPDQDLHYLLVPLIHDADIDVAREAIRAARVVGPGHPEFVPALCALLGHRLLKHDARETLVGYGDDIVPTLAYLLHDPDEHEWVRRHLPATLARLPSQASVEALAATLRDPDGFLRFKAIEALGLLLREHPALHFDTSTVEPLVVKECAHFCNYLTLRQNIVRAGAVADETLLVHALGDKLQRTLDRIYRLLGLLYPWKDVADARFTIEHTGGRLRSSALEYLDNLMRGTVRARVMPLIDEAPIEEKVRHANAVLKTRPRDLVDTLAQLIHDDDPVVSAAAIHVVERRELWTELGSDVEYVLEHRPTSDYVFEAASWVSAARRLGRRSDNTWLEQLPTVELADRLRAVPLFDFVSVDELFRIARTGRQTSYEPGQDVCSEGASPDAVQFLLDGAVSIASDDGQRHERKAPAALAFEAVIEGRPIEAAMQAVDRAVCLRIGAPEFLTMLSDSTEMAQGLFRLLLGNAGSALPIDVRSPTSADGVPSAATRPIEVARLLRTHPVLAYARVDQLLALVAVADHIDLRQGRVLVQPHDRAAVLVILEGEVSLDREGETAVAAGAGAILCVEETLAGTSANYRAVIVAGGRGLRIDRDALFSALADHAGLLQSVFGGVLSTTGERSVIPASSVAG